MDALYQSRRWIAACAALGLLAVALMLSTRPLTPPHAPRIEDTIAVTLTEPPAEAPPPPDVPPPPAPVPPPTPARAPTPTPPPVAPAPRPTPEPAPPAAPAAPAAPSAPPAPAPVPAAATPSPVAPEAAPPAPAPPAPRPVNAESQYIGQTRAYLNAIKRYPTGREASLQRPKGTVRVWYVLMRSGALVEADIEASSNSILLDKQALGTVRRATFPPFPAEAWPGETTHRFTVDLEFTPAAG